MRRQVLVLDKLKQRLMKCPEKQARQFLECGRAVVHRFHPFTIRLKDRIGVKVDPGSKITCIAVAIDEDEKDV